tara:strand:+ start:1241 stop:1597 length:357 start_codon:yes stop_codon:yes gene_type:complete
MAHLSKLPTWFVKGKERRAAYFTVQARELIELGFKAESGEEEPKARKPIERQPEIVVEAGTTAYDSTDAPQEPLAEDGDLDRMTKAELLAWASDQGKELNSFLLKAEILKRCKEIENS